ncbi:hypothetical protein GALMADRAFT_30311, partial [Galerina marginata CBS 339.88]
YDSAERYPPPKCHPETRKSVIVDIFAWINKTPGSSRVLWINGPVGVGKTALAQTICERLQKNGLLGGAFFFPPRTQMSDTSRYLFPTIAYQLAIFLPEVAAQIDKTVAGDPAILDKSIDVLFKRLIVDPLTMIYRPELPIVVVIDALDECEGEKVQCDILRLLSSATLGSSQNIRFIITSRPEPWIRDKFHSRLLFPNADQISLEQSLEANEDIRTVFLDGFKSILNSPTHTQAMRNVPQPWPADRILDDLVESASGQFLYPATVLKFVDDPNHRPTDRLDAISKIPTTETPTPNPLASLDELYFQILSTCANKKLTLTVLGTVMAM